MKTRLSEEHKTMLRLLVARIGVDRAAKTLTTTRTVLTGALAGLAMRRVTAEGLRGELEALRTSPGRQAYVARLELHHRPLDAFLAQCCDVAPDASVGALLLFQAWERWCEAHGVAARTAAVFEQRLLAAVPEVRAARAGPTSKRAVAYAGIGLRP